MWTTIIQIIIGIIALGILVFVHELGHFLVGRALGFKILEFGLGFGPKLVKIRRKGILYSIGIFPLGGFVRFYGEDDDTEDEGAMNSMPKWKRFLVLVAGSGSNIIFGFIVGVILLMSVGNISEEPVITKVVHQSPAYVAGVQEKDRIHSVDGVKADVDNFVILIENAPQNFDMAVIRDEQIVNIPLVKDANNKIGIESSPLSFTGKGESFFQAVKTVGKYTGQVFVDVFKFIGKLFTFDIHANEVAGPVSTVSMVGSISQMGFDFLVYIVMLIAINIGIFNLLPFPALDGGRIFLLLIEAIRRKPFDRNKEGLIHFVGFALLMVVVIVVEIINFTS